MSDFEPYRRRYRRKWSTNRKLLKSLECMGLTVEDAIIIELFNRFAGDFPYPDITPRHDQ